MADALVMEWVAGRRTWTLDTLIDELGRGPASCRDGSARALPLPTALLARPGLEPEPQEAWTEFFGRVYPGDRAELSRAWRATIAAPGEPVRARFRERRSFVWWERELVYINLLDVRGIDAIVYSRRDVGAVQAPAERNFADGDVATSSVPVWQLQHLNELGEVLRCEGFTREMLGVEPWELLGKESLSPIHPDDQAMVVSVWLDLLNEPGGTRTMTLRLHHPQTGYRWYESMTTNRLLDPDVNAMVVISYDIDDRRRKESAIRASERQFRTLAEEIPVAVFRADAQGRITYANDLFRITVGEIDHLRALPAAVGAWWDSVLAGDHSEEVVFELGRRTLRLRGRAQRSDAESERDPGDDVPAIEVPATIEAVIGSVEDVTAAVVRERQLHELAHSDPLTGLANRRVLEQVIESALIDCDPIVVIAADLDGFKALNDDQGHHVGDLVLIEVARRLRATVRPDDLVTRIGGDEFVVVCRTVSDDSIDDLVDRVRFAICEPIVEAGGVLIAASIGSARARAHDDLFTVLRRADEAMYDDKRRRNHRR